MSQSVVQQLIVKDLRLHRLHILLSLGCGAIALALLQIRSEIPFVVGCVWFFISLIVLGSMLPVSNIINEKKKQNLAFVMSLPVSSIQYATSKLVSTVGMFLAPWLMLVIAGVALILGRSDIPDGFIPALLILSGMTLVGFCVIAAAAVVSEAEGPTIAATILCNSTYGLGWYLVIRNPAVRHDLLSPVPVWSSYMLTFLGLELAVVAVVLGAAYYLQSRKRDFV
ncbi:MAG: ABC-2 transporter permease [Bryobacteraceae bacterium]